MPEISRAVKRHDWRVARQLLGEHVDEETVDRAIVELGHGHRKERYGPLTRPEYLTLWAAACGLSIKETAEQYVIGLETVHSHRMRAARKLGVPRGPNSTTAAVAVAYRRGIFKVEDELVPFERWQ
jgi:DNA-binding NarL/FixJ family response regulator